MRLRQSFIFLLVVSALLLQACSADLEADIATAIAETQQISDLQTAAASGGGEVATNTPQPGVPTGTATITPTFTPSIPYVSVNADTNCRTGPTQFYAYVTTITAGQQLEVVATFPDYVVVKQPDGTGDCWLWLRYATTTDFSAYNLPAATQPPTPFPTATTTNTPVAFNWDGTWTAWIAGNAYTMSVNQSGSSISGSFPANPIGTVSISASLSANFQVANGTWTWSGGDSGSFQWQIKSGNPNQFIGSGVEAGPTYAWCGARGGASMPSPCQWP
jgi:hypothetical protein